MATKQKITAVSATITAEVARANVRARNSKSVLSKELCQFPLPEGESYWSVSSSGLVTSWPKIFPIVLQEVLLSNYTLSVELSPAPHIVCSSEQHPHCRIPFTLCPSKDQALAWDNLAEDLDYLCMLRRDRVALHARMNLRKEAIASLTRWQREALGL